MTVTSTLMPQGIGSEMTSTGNLPGNSAGREGRRETKGTPRRAVRRVPSDDEILGLGPFSPDDLAAPNQLAFSFEEDGDRGGAEENPESKASDNTSEYEGSEALSAAFDKNPELRQAWQDAEAYRKAFATPAEAREATALLADLNRMDALFFSKRAEDHAMLANEIARLDPAAFASLARAIQQVVDASSRVAPAEPAAEQNRPSDGNRGAQAVKAAEAVTGRSDGAEERLELGRRAGDQITPQQAEFLHQTNAAAVQSVVDAVETQVEHLLPEGIQKGARNRIVGEIYRELDGALQSNRQLTQQLRQALRSGGLDAVHQRAIVSLVTARAKQALPSLAKRVLNEWTSTVMAAQQNRHARQSVAERRVDIAGASGGANERRTTSPRQVDYSRMSDADILNL